MKFRNKTAQPMCFEIEGRSYEVDPGETVVIHDDLSYVVRSRGLLLEEVDEEAEREVRREAKAKADAEAKAAKESAKAEAEAKAKADAEAKAQGK